MSELFEQKIRNIFRNKFRNTKKKVMDKYIIIVAKVFQETILYFFKYLKSDKKNIGTKY